jgi:hypothetical protein
VHSGSTTAANVQDVTNAHTCLQSQEEVVIVACATRVMKSVKRSSNKTQAWNVEHAQTTEQNQIAPDAERQTGDA